MEELFSQIDRNIKDLNGILVTHEHIDHIKGLGVLRVNINCQFMRMKRLLKKIPNQKLFLILMKRNLLQVSMLNRLTCHMMR